MYAQLNLQRGISVRCTFSFSERELFAVAVAVTRKFKDKGDDFVDGAPAEELVLERHDRTHRVQNSKERMK